MSRLNLRKRTRISYYEPEEPNLDEYVFCTDCGDFVYEYCAIHKPLLVIPDDKVPSKSPYPPSVPRSALTIPRVFLHLAPSVIPGAGIGVFSTLTLPRGVRFGPYRGKKTDAVTSMYSWQIHDGNNRRSHFVDAEDAHNSNWMRFVNCSRHWNEQNLVAYQYKGQLYYRTIKIIPKFTELMVFYGSEFANILQINLKKYNSPVGYAQKLGAPIPQKSILEEKNRNKNLNVVKENAFKETKVAQTVNPKTNTLNDVTVDSNSHQDSIPIAAYTIPQTFLHLATSVIPALPSLFLNTGAGLGVFSSRTIPRGVRFGPYRGKRTNDASSLYSWQVYSSKTPSYIIDGGNDIESNWMRYVNCSRNFHEQNLVAYQYREQIYYSTIKIIPRNTELLVFYGCEYANLLDIDLRKYNKVLPIAANSSDDNYQSNYFIETEIEQATKEVFYTNNVTSLHNISQNPKQANISICHSSNIFISGNTNDSHCTMNKKSPDTMKNIFICQICCKGFNKKSSLSRHELLCENLVFSKVMKDK
nr:uncharacterized protein LOC113391402 [Vanessa tameamea]